MRTCLLLALAAMLAQGTSRAGDATGAACRFDSGKPLRALVELYTSEGCSSCPPADRWLSSHFGPGATASALAFHVDYWDRLGWKDRFAAAAWTERQYTMAAIDRANVVYTPQFALQGHSADAGEIPAALDALRGREARASIAVEVKPGRDGGRVATVDARLDEVARGAAGATRLLVAVTSDGLESRVAAGENRGATLRHDHVVRSLSQPARFEASGTASARIAWSAPAEGRDARLVAFVQRIDGGDVLQSLEVPLDRCAP